MIKLTEITDDARQVLSPVLETGQSFDLNLRFLPVINSWSMNIKFTGDNNIDVEINGIRLVCGSNILKQWSRLIPFGIMCIANDKTTSDIYFIDDFSKNRVSFYILNESEVFETKKILSNAK